MTYELHPSCGNYVAFFEDVNQVKFGYSSNLRRRHKEHERMARRLGVGVPQWREFPAMKGVARITENEIRHGMKGLAVPGSFEYIKGGQRLFAALCDSTQRIQMEIRCALGVAA